MFRRYPASALPVCALTSLALFAAGACVDAAEAPRVERTITVDGSGLEDVTTDLGYRVRVTTFRMAVSDLQFAAAGEVHAQLGLRRLVWLTARAHPGHYTGGEVLGELPGAFLADFLANEPGALGLSTLIAGKYDSANFTLDRARAAQGLSADDPLLGHTALIEGSAERAGERVTFAARIDSPARQVVGIPFDHEVREAGAERIAFAVLTVDPLEGDTLFDGLDFLALAPDEAGVRVLAAGSGDPAIDAAYRRLRRRVQSHDHFRFYALPGGNER